MKKARKTLPDRMVGIFNSMDVLEFIDAIKAHPVIWDVDAKGHYDPGELVRAWKDVCSQMDPEFQDRSEEHQAEFNQLLHKKWKNIKDCYRRELRRLRSDQNDSSDRKVYKYYDSLCFLEPSMYVAPSTDKEDCSDQRELWGEFTQTLATATTSKRLKKEQGEDVDNDLITVLNVNSPRELSEVSTTTDGDSMFMLSLIPEMKKIPDNKRLQVKIKLMNVILEAQTNSK